MTFYYLPECILKTVKHRLSCGVDDIKLASLQSMMALYIEWFQVLCSFKNVGVCV